MFVFVCTYSAGLSLISLCQFASILYFQMLTDNFGLLQTGTAQVTTVMTPVMNTIITADKVMP